MKYNQNVLSKTRQALFKSGVHYASVDESLYKTLKIGYVLFFLWMFFINAAHILSYALKISGKVRNFGVSNHNPMQIELLKTENIEPVLLNNLIDNHFSSFLEYKISDIHFTTNSPE